MHSIEDAADLDPVFAMPTSADDDLAIGDTLTDSPAAYADQGEVSDLDSEPPVNIPRVLYIDLEDDLAALLDRVEATGTPAIVVLPEGARAVRGLVSARLLKRRADAAGITLAAVTTGRVTIAQFTGVGIPCGPTVGEARLKLARLSAMDRQVTRAAASRRAQSAASITSNPQSPGVTKSPAPPDSPPVVRVPASEASPVDDPSLDDTFEADPAQVSDPVDQSANAQAAGATDIDGGRPRKAPNTGGTGLRRILYGIGATVLVLLIALAAWITFFPAATITITYAPRPFDHTYHVALGTGLSGAIPLRHTELSETASVVVSGTGTQLVSDAHAVGTITLANQQDGYVVVPAGTVVVAQGGARYATIADVQVPAAVHSFSGTTNGQQSVSVRAVLGGTSSNCDAGAITAIEGRLAGVLLVTNYAAITGGTMRTEYSVTPADITGAAGRLGKQLALSETAKLNQTYALSPIRRIGPVQLSTPRSTPTTVNGRAAAAVTLTARVAMTYIHADDVQHAADRLRNADLAGHNQQIVPGSERVTASLVGSGKTRSVALHVQARTTPALDTANLRAMLVGRGLADARRLLDGSAANGGWSYAVSTFPSLAGRMPQAAGLITIRVHESGT